VSTDLLVQLGQLLGIVVAALVLLRLSHTFGIFQGTTTTQLDHHGREQVKQTEAFTEHVKENRDAHRELHKKVDKVIVDVASKHGDDE